MRQEFYFIILFLLLLHIAKNQNENCHWMWSLYLFHFTAIYFYYLSIFGCAYLSIVRCFSFSSIWQIWIVVVLHHHHHHLFVFIHHFIANESILFTHFIPQHKTAHSIFLWVFIRILCLWKRKQYVYIIDIYFTFDSIRIWERL